MFVCLFVCLFVWFFVFLFVTFFISLDLVCALCCIIVHMCIQNNQNTKSTSIKISFTNFIFFFYFPVRIDPDAKRITTSPAVNTGPLMGTTVPESVSYQMKETDSPLTENVSPPSQHHTTTPAEEGDSSNVKQMVIGQYQGPKTHKPYTHRVWDYNVISII